MAKQIIHDNYRVEIHPHCWSSQPTPEHKAATCRQIAEDVERHVDDVEWAGVVYDQHVVCSFCGYNWEVVEDEDGKGPVCCCEAQLQWEAIEEIVDGFMSLDRGGEDDGS